MERMKNDEMKKGGKKGVSAGNLNPMKDRPAPVGTKASPGPRRANIKTVKGRYDERTGYGGGV